VCDRRYHYHTNRIDNYTVLVGKLRIWPLELTVAVGVVSFANAGWSWKVAWMIVDVLTSYEDLARSVLASRSDARMTTAWVVDDTGCGSRSQAAFIFQTRNVCIGCNADWTLLSLESTLKIIATPCTRGDEGAFVCFWVTFTCWIETASVAWVTSEADDAGPSGTFEGEAVGWLSSLWAGLLRSVCFITSSSRAVNVEDVHANLFSDEAVVVIKELVIKSKIFPQLQETCAWWGVRGASSDWCSDIAGCCWWITRQPGSAVSSLAIGSEAFYVGSWTACCLFDIGAENRWSCICSPLTLVSLAITVFNVTSHQRWILFVSHRAGETRRACGSSCTCDNISTRSCVTWDRVTHIIVRVAGT